AGSRSRQSSRALRPSVSEVKNRRPCSRLATSSGAPPRLNRQPIAMDLREFIAQFQDHLAPQLDTYEQTIYLYVFRHSRLIGLDQVILGFKSARRHMARGAGEKGKGMSLNTVYS